MLNEQATVETETMTIDGKQVIIEQKADEPVTVTLPEGLDEETKKDYIKQIETGSKLVGDWYRKNQVANQRQAELDKREAELAEREKNLLNAKPVDKAPDPVTDEILPVWKRLGLASEADEDDYAADHPAEYRKAEREYLKDEARAEARNLFIASQKQNQQHVTEQLLTTRIAAAGLDPNEVAAFAKYYGMPFSDKAFDLYKQHHSVKTDPVVAAQLAAQKRQINYITPGVKAKELAGKTVEEMTDDELKTAVEMAKKA